MPGTLVGEGMTTRGLLLLALSLVPVLAGCTTHRRLAAERAAALDSLRAVNAAYRAERIALEDSLAFYAGVRSGQYARDMRALRDRLNRLEYRLAVCRDGAEGVATLAVDDLFAPGTATLTPAGGARLDALAERLRTRHAERIIRVEGYADATPPGPTLRKKYPTNWELSAARAAAVARYLIEHAGMAPERFEVLAFGASRPVARDDTPLGRRLNRRIRIAVLPECG
jgi:chemotaxis protein MotB